jgi:tetratricopeptide (TPR) repeat protein
MKKLTYLALFTFAAFAISSCGSINKMRDTSAKEFYKVTPEVLEERGDIVEMKIEVKYPAKYFNKKATLTVTPILKYEKGETPFTTAVKTFQGEGVQSNAGQSIPYATGGTATFAGSVPFNEDMMNSDFIVRIEADLKGKKIPFGDIKLGDGVIATSKLVMIDPKPVMVPDKYVRIIPESKMADILYIINRAEIRPSELKKEDWVKIMDFISKANGNAKVDLKNLEVSAYASPDGTVELNDKLAQKREGSASEYLTKELKKSKVEKAAQPGFLTKKYTAEDWDGFKKLMESSNIQDKELILRVLSMYSDPVVREKEIKNIAAAYKVIAEDVLPQLRRSKLTVNIDNVGYSDEELKGLWASNPDILKLEEILYTATLFTDLNTKLAIYNKAAANYPTCFRAKNNAGYCNILLGNVDAAQADFDKAKELQNTDVVNNNLGCVALLKGDLVKSQELFTASMGAGTVVNYNLGIIKVIKGDYDAALNYFGNTDEFNTALVKYLKKDNDGSLSTLGRIEKDFAKKYYLKAVILANQSKDEGVFENLRLAFAKDSTLKNRAVVDMEFAKYFENEVFKGLVK